MPSTASKPAQHAFKGLQDWIEVFRAGTHTDSKGRQVAFSEADLDQMVANVALQAPPAVIGHPKEDAPAYAWANEVKRDGNALLVKFSDINPDFERGVDSGAYRNRSVSVLKDKDHGWRLQHIGWLGAALPAVPGLKPLQYSAPEGAEAHEFAMGDSSCMALAFAIDSVGQLLRGLRDWVISKDGLEVANTVLPDWSISSLANAAQQLRDTDLSSAVNPAYSQATGADMSSFTQDDLDRVRTETEARVRAETQAQFSQAEQQLTQLQAERQTERIAGAIAGWKAQGLVLPADEPGLAEFMAAIENGTGAEFQFSRASGEQPLKQTPAQWFANFVASRKPLVKLGATAGDNPPAPADTSNYSAIVERAREFQAAQAKKGLTVSDEVAVARVMANQA